MRLRNWSRGELRRSFCRTVDEHRGNHPVWTSPSHDDPGAFRRSRRLTMHTLRTQILVGSAANQTKHDSDRAEEADGRISGPSLCRNQLGDRAIY